MTDQPTFQFEGEGPDGLPKWMTYPCQWSKAEPGQRCRVAINKQRNASGATWSVEGDINSPTVKPSVHCIGACHFHIKDGQFIPA